MSSNDAASKAQLQPQYPLYYPYSNSPFSYDTASFRCGYSSSPSSQTPYISGPPQNTRNGNINNIQKPEKEMILIDHDGNWLMNAIKKTLPNKLDDIDNKIKELKKLNQNKDTKNEIVEINKKLVVMNEMMMEQKDEDIGNKLDEIQNKLESIDDDLLNVDDKYLDINKIFDDKFNCLNKDVRHIAIMEQKQNKNNDLKYKQIENNYSEIKNGLNTLKEFMSKQNNINNEINEFIKEQKEIQQKKNEEIEIDEIGRIRLWLQEIVKLPQYLDNFILNGFDHLDIIMTVDIGILSMIGIDKIGHKIQILEHCKKYQRDHPNPIYLGGSTAINSNNINYYDSNKNIQIESLSKIHKENEEKLKNKYQESIKKIINLYYSSNDNKEIIKFWRKGDELRDYVSIKFNQRRKKEKLRDQFVVESDPNDTEYGEYITDYLELNDSSNCIDPIILNYTSSKPQTIKQSMLIKKIFINNHERIKELNGEYGVKTIKLIAKNTVIGEYSSKYLLQNDLLKINNEEIINNIDSYGFDAYIDVEMTLKKWKYFNSIHQELKEDDDNDDDDDDDDDIYDIQQPPLKKRKLNNNHNKNNKNKNKNDNDNIISKKIDIIIDGHSNNNEQRSILTFINDCRKSFISNEPTKEDSEYYNIKLITVDINGWPRVFGIALRDIQPNEELASFYGSDFINVQNKKNSLKKRKNQIGKILNKHGMQI